PVPAVVYVPLRVEGATDGYNGAGRATTCEAERDMDRPSIPHAVHPPDRPNRHLTTRSAVTGGTRYAKQLVEEVREGVRVEKRVLEQLEDLAFLALLLIPIVVRLGNVSQLELQTAIVVAGPGARPDRPCTEQQGRSDDAEPLRWIRDRTPAPGHLERLV